MVEINSDDLLTAVEAAEVIGITHQTVRTAIYEGRLPHVDIRGKKFVTREAVLEYKARTQQDGEKPRGRPRKESKMTPEQRVALDGLKAVIAEWNRAAAAPPESGPNGPRKKQELLGRIGEGGKEAVRRYKEAFDGNLDKDLLSQAPATFDAYVDLD